MKTPVIKAVRTFLITLACALLMLPGMAFAAGEKVIPELAELANAGKEVNLHRWQGYLDIAKATGIF